MTSNCCRFSISFWNAHKTHRKLILFFNVNYYLSQAKKMQEIYVQVRQFFQVLHSGQVGREDQQTQEHLEDRSLLFHQQHPLKECKIFLLTPDIHYPGFVCYSSHRKYWCSRTHLQQILLIFIRKHYRQNSIKTTSKGLFLMKSFFGNYLYKKPSSKEKILIYSVNTANASKTCSKHPMHVTSCTYMLNFSYISTNSQCHLYYKFKLTVSNTKKYTYSRTSRSWKTTFSIFSSQSTQAGWSRNAFFTSFSGFSLYQKDIPLNGKIRFCRFCINWSRWFVQ